MTKKQFVINMLGELEPNRPLAKDLKKFVMLDILDNTSVNGIMQLLREMAVYMRNKKVKVQMTQIADKMDKMKNLELQDQIEDKQQIESLLATL